MPSADSIEGFLGTGLRVSGCSYQYYKSCMTLRTLYYGSYGIFLSMGDAGFLSSTV